MNGAIQFSNVSVVFLFDATFALVLGVLLTDAWMSSAVAQSLLIRRPLWALSGMLVAGHLLRPWFVAASMTGSSQFLTALAAVPDVLTATRQGKLWLAGLAIIIFLVAALLSWLRRTAPWLVAALLLLLAAVKAASGHPADEGDFTLVEVSQLVHVLGTSIWAGAVIVSGFTVVPYLIRTTDAAAVRRYASGLSGVVTWALVALLMSGVYTADRELKNSLSALWSSAWGRILTAKVFLVLIAVGFGATNRYKCVRKPPTAESTALLSHLLRAEAVVMLVILYLSALLANTSPAMPEH